jgi:hypothetical protein
MGMPKFQTCRERGPNELTWAAVCWQGHLEHVTGELERTRDEAEEDRKTLRDAVNRAREEKAQLAADIRAANELVAESKKEIERLREVLFHPRCVVVVVLYNFFNVQPPDAISCSQELFMYVPSQVLL